MVLNMIRKVYHLPAASERSTCTIEWVDRALGRRHLKFQWLHAETRPGVSSRLDVECLHPHHELNNLRQVARCRPISPTPTCDKAGAISLWRIFHLKRKWPLHHQILPIIAHHPFPRPQAQRLQCILSRLLLLFLPLISLRMKARNCEHS